VTVPPAAVLELCRTSCAVTQSAPARCERLGEGEGLGECDGECDGDGLGEPEFDGLGLWLCDGLGLLVWLGLEDGLLLGLGLREELVLLDGLGLSDRLADFDGLALELRDRLALAEGDDLREARSLAEATATEARPHGEPAGRAADASAGAIANPETRKDPAMSATAARPARMIPAGTKVLRSSAGLSRFRSPKAPIIHEPSRKF
jgi:hypothetical protein